jgi:hypothetical protein
MRGATPHLNITNALLYLILRNLHLVRNPVTLRMMSPSVVVRGMNLRLPFFLLGNQRTTQVLQAQKY